MGWETPTRPVHDVGRSNQPIVTDVDQLGGP